MDKLKKEDLLALSNASWMHIKAKFRSQIHVESDLQICRDFLQDHRQHLTETEVEQLWKLEGRLSALLEERETPSEPQEAPEVEYPSREAAERAFKAEYEENDDLPDFIKHLEVQRAFYHDDSVKKAPYFPVIQSSGYGKSKLATRLMEGYNGYVAIYWSFANETACPPKNVNLVETLFASEKRGVLQSAFVIAIQDAVLEVTNNSTLSTLYEIRPSSGVSALTLESLRDTLEDFPKKIIFVMDEVSNLLRPKTGDGVSFFAACAVP